MASVASALRRWRFCSAQRIWRAEAVFGAGRLGFSGTFHSGIVQRLFMWIEKAPEVSRSEGKYRIWGGLGYAGAPIKSIRKGFTAALRRAEIGHCRIHDLRHMAAATMLGGGVPIENVAQVLGHSNIAVTYRVYGRYMPEHMQEAVNVLDFAVIKRPS